MSTSLKILLGGIAVIAALTLAGFILLSSTGQRDEVMSFNQEIQFDDFAFSVLDSRAAKMVGPESAQVTAHGIFYIVKLQVANHAVRVPFTFDRHSAILVDNQRVEHLISPDAQAALDAVHGTPDSCGAPLEHGTTCVTELVFDVPADTHAPWLRMSFGGAVGSTLDLVVYGNRVIQLK
jgi:hypothetical protein